MQQLGTITSLSKNYPIEQVTPQVLVDLCTMKIALS